MREKPCKDRVRDWIGMAMSQGNAKDAMDARRSRKDSPEA